MNMSAVGKLTLTRLESVTITRVDVSGEPVIVDGYAQQPDTSEIVIEANVQPAPARDVKQLPGGDLLMDVLKIWSNSEIQIRDRILWRGRYYSVIKMLDWLEPTFCIQHYAALMVGEDDSANAN
jgi:hypothetical protein